MRTATSTDYFVRTPANCINVRSSGEAQIDGHHFRIGIDVRLNRQNYTRGLAIHAPSSKPSDVAKLVLGLAPQLSSFANLDIGERNIIIAASPDVPLGAGFAIDNNVPLKLIERAPWIEDGCEIESRDFALSKFVFVYCDCDELSAELLATQQETEATGFQFVFLGERYIEAMTKGETPAFFISYDARNREDIARPIAARLAEVGESVWFDDFNLRPGDNLRQTLEDGLRKCRQCVLLITKEFLSNEAWAKVEFDAIFSREVTEKRKIIIPVWVDVTRAEVDHFSMSLANKFAVTCTAEELSTSVGIERVAHAITTAKPPI